MGHKANIDPPWRKNARASIVITPRCHKCCQCYAVCGAAATAAAAVQQHRGNAQRCKMTDFRSVSFISWIKMEMSILRSKPFLYVLKSLSFCSN